MKDIERLEFLQPYANRFAEDLLEMATVPQKDQLRFISSSLNELVESNVRYGSWSRSLELDHRMHSMIDALEELKNVRNIIIHRSKTLTYAEIMNLLHLLYEHGQYIDWMISRAISILEENR